MFTNRERRWFVNLGFLVLVSLLAMPAWAGQNVLSWTDNAANETSQEVERKAGAGAYSPLVTVGANVVTYTDAAVSLGEAYCYRVKAVNAGGSSAWSNEACRTVPHEVTLILSGTPSSGSWALEATTSVPGTIHVEFWEGTTLRRDEASAPYCLFGNPTGGTCTLGSLGAGTHAIEARVFAQGGTTVLASATLVVEEGVPPPAAPSNLTVQ